MEQDKKTKIRNAITTQRGHATREPPRLRVRSTRAISNQEAVGTIETFLGAKQSVTPRGDVAAQLKKMQAAMSLEARLLQGDH